MPQSPRGGYRFTDVDEDKLCAVMRHDFEHRNDMQMVDSHALLQYVGTAVWLRMRRHCLMSPFEFVRASLHRLSD
jgi:hypothetical protein